MRRRNFVGEGQRAKPIDLCGGAVGGVISYFIRNLRNKYNVDVKADKIVILL
jgi:hypothetical protein